MHTGHVTRMWRHCQILGRYLSSSHNSVSHKITVKNTSTQFKRVRKDDSGCITQNSRNKYVGPPYCPAEMYAGRIACCPLVSHVEYASHALLRLEKPGQIDRRTDGLSNWLPWQLPLSHRESGAKPAIYDQIPTIILYGKNLMKIGPVDPEIALLKSLFFKKKLPSAEHNYSPRACMWRGLNKVRDRALQWKASNNSYALYGLFSVTLNDP